MLKLLGDLLPDGPVFAFYQRTDEEQIKLSLDRSLCGLEGTYHVLYTRIFGVFLQLLSNPA